MGHPSCAQMRLFVNCIMCVCACVFIERERVVYGIGFTTLLGIDVDM